MNFLAHAYLSGDNPAIMTGNFIGDFVKGRNLNDRFDADIVKGIELHRSIDAFTDVHAVVGQSKARLRNKYHHYAAVIVDMLYDHLLAKNWSSFSNVPLKEYTLNVYASLMRFDSILPDDMRYMLTYMMRDNWLLGYARIEGIHRALSGMSRRTRFQSHMDEAVNDLTENYAAFENEFLQFFPDLQKHAEDFLKT